MQFIYHLGVIMVQDFITISFRKALFLLSNGVDNEKVENVVVARFDGQGY